MPQSTARARILVAAVWLSCCSSALAAQTPVHGDTASLADLLLTLRDTTPGVREQATLSLRLHALAYLPTLEEWMVDRSMARSGAASAALVLIGPSAYPAIRRALLDPERRFRIESAFGVIDSAPALLTMLEQWLVDLDPAVRAAAVGALDVYRDDAVYLTDAILRALDDPHPEVRAAALALHATQIDSDSTQRRLVARLMPFLESEITTERRAAVYNLGNSHPHGRAALPRILVLAEHDPDVEIRFLAARVLTWQRADPQDAQPVLLRMLADAADTVRFEALLAMGAIGVADLSPALTTTVVEAIESRLASTDRGTRRAAATALAYIGSPTVRQLVSALRSSDTTVAVTAAEGLSALPHLREIDAPLIEALSDPRAEVREAAALALVGPGARIESTLRSLVDREPDHRSAAASMTLGLITVQRMFDVVDRCYRIVYGEWVPPIPFATIEGILPPTAIRFRPTVARRPYQDRPASFVIEQSWDAEWYRTGWWLPDTVLQEVYVNASPQLSGVSITIRSAQPGLLLGVASTYWDFRREREEASVRLEEFGCQGAP